jgi:hypothetical protein
MAEQTLADPVEQTIEKAKRLRKRGDARAAIDLLTEANRAERNSALEVALVEHRLIAARQVARPETPAPAEHVAPEGDGGELFEIGPEDLSVEAYHTGLARSGCLLVRGLVPPDRAASLAAGIDSALAAFDKYQEDPDSVDPAWYTHRRIRDRAGSSDKLSRLNRRTGALWTVFSPRMVFELFELVDEIGLGEVMTEHLGERPLLSANKGTLRRVPPEDMLPGWHQDGAFLGDSIGSFNFWVTLTACGRDAPGLDVVPKRFDGVLPPGEGAIFPWSLAHETVVAAAGDASIIRPELGVGDALLFDHRLVHRTASSASMQHSRYALESWFFAPSAYPADDVPVLY